MQVWFVSVALKVVQWDSKAHRYIISLCCGQKQTESQVSFKHCIALCSAFYLDLPQLSRAIYG